MMTDFAILSSAGHAQTAAVPYSGGAAARLPITARLLPRPLRRHLLVFQRFIRSADMIADNPKLEYEAKLALLDALERALGDGKLRYAYLQPTLDLRQSLSRCAMPDTAAREMLGAFRRDVKGVHCRNWHDLLAYCRQSASPIGTTLLTLHGEGPAAISACDALYAAMRALSLIQNCRMDWVNHGRCYLPRSWFRELRLSPERLVERQCDSRMRQLFDRALDAIDDLLIQAAPLPALLRHRALRLEAACAHSTARALAARLRLHDPLAQCIALPWPVRLLAAMRGLLKAGLFKGVG